MSIEDAIKRYSCLAQHRIELANESFSIRSCERGIVFVLAVWSASSLAALRNLTSALASDSNNLIQLTIVDADRITESLVEELNYRPQGEGEGFWIKNGRVVARLVTWNSTPWESEIPIFNAKLIG